MTPLSLVTSHIWRRSMSTKVRVVFDAADPHALARFWAQALQYQQEDHSGVVDQLLATGQLREADVVKVGGRRAFRTWRPAMTPTPLGHACSSSEYRSRKLPRTGCIWTCRSAPPNASDQGEGLVALGASVAWM